MLIAQLSDPHVRAEGRLAYGVVDTRSLLEQAVESLLVAEPRPDLVLLTGDVAFDGEDEDYRTAAEVLAKLPMPVAAIPGNHDHRERLRGHFPPVHATHFLPGFMQYVLDAGPVRILALDTLVPGAPHGELCPKRLDWLEQRLAEAPDRPTVVMMHHPPVLTGIGHMDAMNLRNAEELGAIVERHPNIERILCGHIHRPIQARWRGTLAVVAPSCTLQLVLDLRPGAEAAFNLEPPAYLLHHWQPGTGLVTHQAYVDTYPGPYSFET